MIHVALEIKGWLISSEQIDGDCGVFEMKRISFYSILSTVNIHVLPTWHQS